MGHPGWLEADVATPAGPVAAMDWGGVGSPMLFLHGDGANAAEWAPLVARLRDQFRCISFDSYGHGASPAVEGLTFETLLDQVEAVTEHFRLPQHRLTLVGNALGGALAVAHEALRPGCRAVVGVDAMPTAVHVGLRPDPDGVQHTAEHYRALGSGWSGDHAAYEKHVAELVAAGQPELCARRAHQFGADGRYHLVPSPEVRAAMHNLGIRPDNPFVRIDNYDMLRCPVLLLCGTEGTAADNRDFVDSMPRRFPMVTVTWLEGGHGLHRRHPELVAGQIKRFLSDVERPLPA